MAQPPESPPIGYGEAWAAVLPNNYLESPRGSGYLVVAPDGSTKPDYWDYFIPNNPGYRDSRFHLWAVSSITADYDIASGSN